MRNAAPLHHVGTVSSSRVGSCTRRRSTLPARSSATTARRLRCVHRHCTEGYGRHRSAPARIHIHLFSISSRFLRASRTCITSWTTACACPSSGQQRHRPRSTRMTPFRTCARHTYSSTCYCSQHAARCTTLAAAGPGGTYAGKERNNGRCHRAVYNNLHSNETSNSRNNIHAAYLKLIILRARR